MENSPAKISKNYNTKRLKFKKYVFFIKKAKKREKHVSLLCEKVAIYGMYVNGRNWFLVVLENNSYTVSTPYDITSDDIFDLFALLEHLRNVMVALYQGLP